MPQVRQHAALVDILHTFQTMYMQHLAPVSEPCASGALSEFLRTEVGIDDGLDTPARGVSASHAGAHTVRQAPTERTERRLEQAVLVVEVMRHQTRRDLG